MNKKAAALTAGTLIGCAGLIAGITILLIAFPIVIHILGWIAVGIGFLLTVFLILVMTGIGEFLIDVTKVIYEFWDKKS